MKMTIAEATEHVAELEKLGGIALPARLGYIIARNTERLKKEVHCAEQERVKLCERCAEKDEDGKPVLQKHVINGKEVSTYKIREDSVRDFAAELGELQKTEIDIDIRCFKAEELYDCDGGRYTALTQKDIRALLFMLEG